MLDKILRIIKKFIPRKLFAKAQPYYHYMMAFLGSFIYRNPSRELFVIGVTGTKGKSSTVEFMNGILKAAGYKTAVTSTIHFMIDNKKEPNLYKMSMPGRMFMQRFLRRAVDAGCTHVILEMTSEGARQFRHRFIDMNMLIYTNLAPEHIESHGSFEAYKQAKLSIARALDGSKKEKTWIIANKDDEYHGEFLKAGGKEKLTYSLSELSSYSSKPSISFIYEGLKIYSPLRGSFNISNMLAAITAAKAMGISPEALQEGLKNVERIPGRVQKVETHKGFDVYVDYAHTPESLESLYKAFSGSRIIGVLGNTGGGRDKWKREKMAQIADEYCDYIILTNEDPYDEDPQQIVDEMMTAIKGTPARIILDRREAILKAMKVARKGDVVLITGKGTDPYIMGPRGSKIEWSDYGVVREELKKIQSKN